MAIPLLVILSTIALPLSRALIITLPSTTITTGPLTLTYQSEASDPAGNLSFWISHPGGVGGFFGLEDNVVPSTTPTKLQVNLFDEIGDGQKWEVAAGPTSERLDGLFAFSDPVVVVPLPSSSSSPSSSSASLPAASSASAVSSTSATPSSSNPKSTNAPASSSPSPSASSTSRTTAATSSPSVGLIVGVTFGATAVLIIILLFAFLYIRKLRRRRRNALEPPFPIEPAFLPSSAFATSRAPAGSSLSSDGLAPKIEPFMPTSSVSISSPSQSDSAPRPPTTMSAKAAQARQEYLMNQMRAVQWQLQALQGAGAGGPTSPSTTSDGSASVSGSGGEVGTGDVGLRLQNEALQQRIRALEEQLQSQWALGLSDEPPPGYLE